MTSSWDIILYILKRIYSISFSPQNDYISIQPKLPSFSRMRLQVFDGIRFRCEKNDLFLSSIWALHNFRMIWLNPIHSLRHTSGYGHKEQIYMCSVIHLMSSIDVSKYLYRHITLKSSRIQTGVTPLPASMSGDQRVTNYIPLCWVNVTSYPCPNLGLPKQLRKCSGADTKVLQSS